MLTLLRPSRGLSRSVRYPIQVPQIPIGTLTQKTARQCHSDSNPPTTSPANEPPMAATWFTPKAKPRRSAGNASVMIAVELAVSIAPPTPCTTRSAISSRAPADPVLGTSAQATEASVKIRKPRLNSFARPYWSPSLPKVTTRTAVTSR